MTGRKVPVSPDSLALGLCRRALSTSRFFRSVLWLESELIVLFVKVGMVGMVLVLDWEKRRPPKPGPAGFMGVCSCQD